MDRIQKRKHLRHRNRVREVIVLRQAALCAGRSGIWCANSMHRAALDRALGVLDRFGLILIEVGKDVGEVAGNFRTHLRDELGALAGDAHHDLAAIFGGVRALDFYHQRSAVQASPGVLASLGL